MDNEVSGIRHSFTSPELKTISEMLLHSENARECVLYIYVNNICTAPVKQQFLHV